MVGFLRHDDLVFFLFVLIPGVAAFFYHGGVAWLKTQMARPGSTPLVVLLAGAGLIVMLFAMVLTKVIRDARGWPTAPGKIVESGIKKVAVYRNRRRRILHRARVVYQYEANGRQFMGDRVRIALSIATPFPFIGKKMADHYPVGRELDVYHNPAKPGESVLNPHADFHYVLWLIGLVATASAIGPGCISGP